MINNSEKMLVSTFKGLPAEENNINFFNDKKYKTKRIYSIYYFS